jgi:hypothetical protein
MRLSLIALVALAALAGCSSDDEPETTPTPSSTAAGSSSAPAPAPATDSVTVSEAPTSEEEVLKQRVQTYTTAMFAGDGAAAYELLSPKCRKEVPLSELAATAEQINTTYGEVDFTIDSVRIEGDQADVDGTTGVPALDEPDPNAEEFNWVRESGEWFNDPC